MRSGREAFDGFCADSTESQFARRFKGADVIDNAGDELRRYFGAQAGEKRVAKVLKNRAEENQMTSLFFLPQSLTYGIIRSVHGMETIKKENI